MSKRQLTEDEKKLYEINLESMRLELDYAKAMVKQTKTAIEIAPIVYEKQFEELENKLKKLNYQVKELEDSISIGNQHIIEGVEENGDTSTA